KTVSVVGGGPALAGSTLEYDVRVTNVASVPAFNLVISDNLDADTPGQLSYVAGLATLNGSTAGVTGAGPVITADHGSAHGSLAPNGSALLRFRALINANAPTGTPVTNTGVVDWNTPSQRLTASVTVNVGSTPGVGVIGGTVWHDFNFDKVFDAGRAL